MKKIEWLMLVCWFSSGFFMAEGARTSNPFAIAFAMIVTGSGLLIYNRLKEEAVV